MKSDRLQDAIGEAQDSYLEDAALRPERKRSALRWAAAAAACLCVCLIGVGLLSRPASEPQKSGELLQAELTPPAPAPKQPETPASERPEEPAPEEREEPAEELREGPAPEDHWDEEPAAEPTEPEIMAPDATVNSFAAGVDIDTGRTAVVMIESYPSDAIEVDLAVENGGVLYSDALAGAFAAYGDTVLYRVGLTLFRDGVSISADSPEAQKELERLVAADYVTVYEVFRDANGTEHPRLSLHAKMTQLLDFPASSTFGYLLTLYDEGIADSLRLDQPAAYSGPAQIIPVG